MEKVCTACGAKFVVKYPSSSQRCCSAECRKKRHGVKHGASYSRLHGIWCGMKSRCSKESKTAAMYYSDRGIDICDEWRDSFTAFQSWALANGYREDLSIDRRENDKGYSPDNCRWATRIQQMANTRKRRHKGVTSRFKGVAKTHTNGRWRANGCVKGKPVNLGCFGSEEEAARAYDAWAIKTYGEFASPNFPVAQGGVPS